jgi:hypothetical protein
MEHDIMLDFIPTGGNRITFNPVSQKAKAGAPVMVTLTPNAGSEPDNFTVYKTRFILVDFTPTDRYTYTFTMPNEPVWVHVDFLPIADVIENTAAKISTASSWDDIAVLNDMIKKAQGLILPTNDPAKVTAAITKLAGIPRTSNTPSAANPVDDSWNQLGIVIAKMRSEDISKWIPFNYPSYPMDRGVDNTALPTPTTTPSSIGYPLGQDITHLYYVRDDNAAIPPMVPEEGWQPGNPSPLNITPPNLVGLDGVQQITLTYEVGIYPATLIQYRVWLIPVAQYTIQYDPSATGKVYIQDHYPTRQLGNTTTPSVPGVTTSGYYTDSKQTLDTTTPRRTGHVGKATTPGSLTLQKEVFTVITTDRPSVNVSITDSSGYSVMNILSADGSSIVTTTSNLLITSTTPGAFYPESKRYTIRVRATSVPGTITPP